MKKLLLGALIVFGGILSTKAQTTILYHNFNSTTTTLPSGWDTGYFQYHPGNPGWKFNNVFPTHLNSIFKFNTPLSNGYVAYIDDIDYDCTVSPWVNNKPFAAFDYDTLYLKSINCSTYTHVFVSLDLNFNNYTNDEVGTIAVSTDGGHTWPIGNAINLPSLNGNTEWQDSLIFDITAYAAGQSNVMVAFTWNNKGAVGAGYAGWGMAIGNVNIYAPAPFDVQVTSQSTFYLMQVGNSYSFSGNAYNFGSTAITGMQMNYSVNGGSPVSQTLSGIGGFSPLTSYAWSMNSTSASFTPNPAGNYVVKFWANDLNGANANVNTDTLTTTFRAPATIPVKDALYEEFTGQSCVFCMLAAPNMDSVYTQNAAATSLVRYHVPIPARDFMYDATETFVNQRSGIYGVDEAPTGYMDGTYLNPSMYQSPPENTVYSSTTLQAENTIGSSFSIDITSAKFIAKKDSFYVSANITAYSTFPAGLIANIALTIDSITYKYDLSMDDPRQSFAAPIGSSAAGYSLTGAPDYYYPYVLKYPVVCEEMFPSSGAGTSLAAFTSVGQMQTVSYGWKKNHPWGLYDKPTAQRDSDFYDSSRTCHFVVWVQTNDSIPSLNSPGLSIPANYVFQSATSQSVLTGIDEVSIGDGVSFAMYPNPANNNTNLAFKLDNDQNVNVQVYNMLGQSVYSAAEGVMTAGQHTILINSSSLQSGIYIVRFSTDNSSTTQKLVIQR